MHLHLVTGRDVTVGMVNEARILAEKAYEPEFSGPNTSF